MKKELLKKRKRTLLLQFKEALALLSSYLSAGYSPENAIVASLNELIQLFGEQAFIVRDYKAIVHGMQFHIPLSKLLSDFALRTGLDDILNFSEVFNVASKSGGELVHIISETSGIIRDKLTIKEDILTLNAAKRYEQKVMNMLPFFIILYMNYSSPSFFTTLYTTIPGRILMTLCLIFYIGAIYLADHILDIEV